MRRRIDIHVDELRIAEGQGSPDIIAGEIAAQLQRLVDEKGWPATTGGHVDKVVTSYRGDRSGPGSAAARAVYEGIVSHATDSN